MRNKFLKIMYLLSKVLLNNGFAMESFQESLNSSCSSKRQANQIEDKGQPSSLQNLNTTIVLMNQIDSKNFKDFLCFSQVSKIIRQALTSACLDIDLLMYRDQITDDVLENLSKIFPKARSLKLLMCLNITAKGLQVLKNFQALISLDLSYTNSNDDVLKAIENHKQLTSLRLLMCQNITDEGLQVLKNFQALTFLDLSYTNSSDAVLQIIENHKQLTSLKVGGCEKYTEQGLRMLVNFHKLTSLDVSHTNSGDVVLQSIAHHENLTYLCLERCNNCTDQGLSTLVNLKRLRFLNLHYCSQITKEAVLALCSHIPDLIVR